jgi:hypothetical protein
LTNPLAPVDNLLVRVLLRTACGSTRIVEMERIGLDYKIPLPAVYNASAELEKDPEWVPPPPAVREFVYAGEIPVYDERIA